MECAEIMPQETPQVPKKTRRKFPIKRAVALVVAAAVVVGGGFGIKTLFFQNETQTALTETTTYGSLSTVIEGTGTTMPADSVTYTTASTTEITGVYVSAGDTVEAGDLLYTQDDSELDEEIEEYQDELTELQNTLSDASDQLSELNERLSDLKVTAPFSGRITDVTVWTGDTVGSGTKLATLVDDSKMTLTQYFSYAYEDQVYVGMKAGVSIASLMTTLDGTVTEIKKVDRVTAEGTRCFAVTVTLDNPGALTEGMSGAGYLLTDGGEKLYPAVEGTLEPYASEDITATESGKLTAVNVDDYETVTAGTTLFVIDGSDLEDQVETTQRSITQTQEKITQTQEKITEAEEKRSDYQVTAEIGGKIIMVGAAGGGVPPAGGSDRGDPL